MSGRYATRFLWSDHDMYHTQNFGRTETIRDVISIENLTGSPANLWKHASL
jgi:hypothetical protein